MVNTDHKIAVDLYKSLFPKIRVHVFEEGYIRPYWVTHELGGVNRNTAIPKDASFYESIIPQKKYSFTKLKPSFRFMIIWSFLYYMFTPACSHIFEHYVSHRPTSSALDARYWLKRLFRYKLSNIEADKLQKKIKLENKNYFLVPLQLWSDSQIQINSPFCDLEDFINYTIENFSKFAPLNTVLIFKNHPQDNGIFNLRKRVHSAAEAFKVSSRVYFIDGGTIPKLIKPSIGVVLVNSTAGLQAINHGKPTICLGDSFYDIEGLTNHSALELFWHNPIPPDSRLYKKFYDYLINNIQINGSFYSPDGISLLVRNTAEKLASY